MKSLKVSVIALVGLCGCGGQAPSAKSGAPPTAPVATPSAPAPNAYSVPDAATPTISEADHPGTIDEFRSQFVRLYNKDMYAPFVELAYWGTSTNEQKTEYLSYVRQNLTLNGARTPPTIDALDQTQAIPIERYGEDDPETRYSYYPRQGEESLELIPKPTHVLYVKAYFVKPKANAQPAAQDDAAGSGDLENQEDAGDAEVVEEEFYVEDYYAVGVQDGKYYFCTIKRD